VRGGLFSLWILCSLPSNIDRERGLPPAAVEVLVSAYARTTLFFSLLFPRRRGLKEGNSFSWSLGRFRCAMRGAVWGAGGFFVVVFRVVCWIPMKFFVLFFCSLPLRGGISRGGRGGYIL
jgi:hypothetical protein